MLALKLLLLLVVEKGIHSLQVFGESLKIVKWVKGDQNCFINLLLPILEEIKTICNHFNFERFDHVYREMNQEADTISKAGRDQYTSWSMAHQGRKRWLCL